MEGTNKVTVKIYGQEYTIAGDATRENIIKVADFVDTKMHEMSRVTSAGPLSSLSVLTSINIADEYFKALRSMKEGRTENERLEKDASHYIQLWEEAKKSYVQYKEDAQSTAEQLQETQKLYHEKTISLDRKDAEYNELKRKFDFVTTKNEDLIARMRSQEENKESRSAEIKELTEKCKDMENSFFDLQMENIHLKGELERLKKIVE